MSYRKVLLGWALCFTPVAAAAAAACASGPAPSDWTGTPAPTGAASTAANQGATGSSGGTQAGGTGVTTGVSASSSGGTSPSGSSSGTPVTSMSSSSGASSGSSDASTSGSSSGGTPTTTQSQTTPDIFADAGPYAPPAEAGSGEHHPGESCNQSNCHGSLEPDGRVAIEPFAIGGTVFKDYAGTIPYPGVEVRVQDATGRTRTTYSHDNGNFSFGGTLALPAIVAVRDGTTTRPMVTQLTTAAMGSCAMAGCHVVGGSPSTGAYYPIHVP